MRTEDKTMKAVGNHSYTSYLALSFLPATLKRNTLVNMALLSRGEHPGAGEAGSPGSEPCLGCCCELLCDRGLACELLRQHLHLGNASLSRAGCPHGLSSRRPRQSQPSLFYCLIRGFLCAPPRPTRCPGPPFSWAHTRPTGSKVGVPCRLN